MNLTDTIRRSFIQIPMYIIMSPNQFPRFTTRWILIVETEFLEWQ